MSCIFVISGGGSDWKIGTLKKLSVQNFFVDSQNFRMFIDYSVVTFGEVDSPHLNCGQV